MALWKPDQTFYPSARMAMQAPREKLGYVVTFNPTPANGKRDALCVLDLDSESKTYSQVVGRAEVPNAGDELHHFGWNACSAALCPYAPHPHIERRYLLVPGLRSSRIYIFDTKPDARNPKLVKTSSRLKRSRRARATAGRIRSIADPTRSTSARWALRTATGPAEFSCSITKASTCWGDGRSIAGRSSSPTISGGISAGTSPSPANGARPT